MAELTLTGMRVVQEVAARGSFTAAAFALGYTQSAVSRQVALMEQATGRPLFARQARGVTPTAAGAALLVHIAAVLDRVAAAELDLAELDDRLAGRVVLGAFPTALAALVPRAVAALAAAHPGIDVRLREGGSVAQLRRVRAGRVDVAVVAVGAGLDYDLDDLRVDHVLTGEWRVAVAADHRLAERGWAVVGELAQETWIVGLPDAGGPQFGPWPWLTESPRIGHAVRDWTARLGLVAAGLGVAIVPLMMVPALPSDVRAIRVDDPRAERRRVMVATRPERSRAVDELIAALHTSADAFAAR